MTLMAAFAVIAFLIWAAALAGNIVEAVYTSADGAAPLLYAEYFDERGDDELVLGSSPWFEPLYALVMTKWLPNHVEVWKAGPFLLYALTVSLTGWTVARAVSRRAGLLVGLAMAAPIPTVFLFVIGAANSHGHTLFHAVLLAAFLVTLPKLDGWARPARLLWATGLAITLAPGASSDVILILGGVLPFLVAVAFAGWLRLVHRGTALLAASACAVGTAGGRVIARLIEDQGIRTNGAEFPFADGAQAVENVGLLLEDVATFAHGQFGGSANTLDGALELIAIAAVVTVLVLVYRARHRLVGVVMKPGIPVERRLLTVYWAAAAAAVATAFVGSSAPDGQGIGSTRYVLILWPALLTLGVAVYGRRSLPVVATIATVSAILGCLQLDRGDYAAPFPVAHGEEAGRIERFVTAQGADHGYAGYGDAMTLTVQTDFDVRAYPVEPCTNGTELAPYSGSHQGSWYQGKPDVRTFYLVNPASAPSVPPPPAHWGPPAAMATFGPLQLYVYDHDLAFEFRSSGCG
jgi:hypothetical protein